MHKYDILIIGGGIVGVAHAYHCLQAGLRVALMERNAYARDASVRNFGQIVPSGFGTKWQRIGRESLRTYKKLQQQTDITVKQEGSIYLANDEDEVQLLEELAELNRHEGYASALWTKQQCLEYYPGLKSAYVRCGLYFPEEITVDPRQAIRKIIDFLVAAKGLHYIARSTVKNVVKANGEVYVTTGNQHTCRADQVFICTGTEFKLLFPELYAKSDLELVKLQMMDTVPQKRQRIPGSVLTGWTIRRYESFTACPSYTAIKEKEDTESFQRRHGVHMLFKQSPDGSVIIGDSHHYAPVEASEGLSFDTNNEINCFMLRQAQRIFDFEDYSIRNTWLGYYCQSKSEELFRKTIDDSIHIVTGIGGKGMTGAFGFAKQHIEELLSLKLQ